MTKFLRQVGWFLVAYLLLCVVGAIIISCFHIDMRDLNPRYMGIGGAIYFGLFYYYVVRVRR
jgi:hypothetical protein